MPMQRCFATERLEARTGYSMSSEALCLAAGLAFTPTGTETLTGSDSLDRGVKRTCTRSEKWHRQGSLDKEGDGPGSSHVCTSFEKQAAVLSDLDPGGALWVQPASDLADAAAVAAGNGACGPGRERRRPDRLDPTDLVCCRPRRRCSALCVHRDSSRSVVDHPGTRGRTRMCPCRRCTGASGRPPVPTHPPPSRRP